MTTRRSAAEVGLPGVEPGSSSYKELARPLSYRPKNPHKKRPRLVLKPGPAGAPLTIRNWSYCLSWSDSSPTYPSRYPLAIPKRGVRRLKARWLR